MVPPLCDHTVLNLVELYGLVYLFNNTFQQFVTEFIEPLLGAEWEVKIGADLF